MAKKLTKNQLKQLEEIKKQKYNYRYDLVSAVENYWDDVRTTEKYYKLNNMKDKLDYYGDLKDKKEKQNLLDRYNILKELNVKVEYDREDPERETWCILRTIYNSENRQHLNRLNDTWFKDELTKEDLYVDDTIWAEYTKKMFMDYANACGYTRIQYFHDNSSGSLEDIYDFINYGCKVIGTNTILTKKWFNKDEEEIYKRGIVLELPEDPAIKSLKEGVK